MKKRLGLILSAILIVALSVIFISCNNDDPAPESAPTNQQVDNKSDHEHIFGEWQTVTEPTCTEKGKNERVCACGEKEVDEIPARGHTSVKKPAVPATCTKTGLTEGEYCSVCKAEIKKQTVVPKIAHSFGEWEITEEATCTHAGLKKHVCAVCGAVEEEETFESHTYLDSNVCTVCGTAHGETEGLVFTLNDNDEYEVTGYEGEDNEVFIPETHEGKAVTGIAKNAFGGNKTISFVFMPNSIMEIKTGAFSGCSNLSEAVIAGEPVIEADVFAGCHISKATGRSTIFQKLNETNDASLTEIVITGGSIEDETFKNKRFTSLTILDAVTDIEDDAFENCTIIKATVPAYAIQYIKNNLLSEVNVTGGDIAKKSFKDLENLKTVTISDAVTEIGKDAFKNCKVEKATAPAFAIPFIVSDALREITVTSGLSIEDGAFEVCKDLRIVYLADSIVAVDDDAFVLEKEVNEQNNVVKKCPVEKAVIPACAAEAIANDALKTVTITSGNVADEAFKGIRALKKAVISDAVMRIGTDAFAGCAVEEATVPAFAIPYIKNDALKEIKITSGDIGDEALKNSALKKVEICDSITNVGREAFAGCSALTTVTLSADIAVIGENAFDGCEHITKVIYNGIITDWINITFTNERSNPATYTRSVYGPKINEENEVEIVLLDEISLPDGATSISDYAFAGLIINEIVISDTVTDIGENAFKNCKVQKATVPAVAISRIKNAELKEITVTSGAISEEALKDAGKLKTVTIDDAVTSIGNDAFKNCPIEKATVPASAISHIKNDALKEITITSGSIASDALKNVSSLKTVTISDGVTVIGSEAFSGCSGLTTVTIPGTVTSIGADAFKECDKITKVIYTGDVSEWVAIDFANEKSNPVAIAHLVFIPEIGENGEERNVLLTELAIPDGTTVIKDFAFAGLRVSEVEVPATVTEIGEQAFSGCVIEKATIPATAIPFIKNDSLKELIISSGTGIAEEALSGCTQLKQVTLCDELIEIGDDAFDYCPIEKATVPAIAISLVKNAALTEITITKGEIIANALKNASSLKTITISDAVTAIGEGAFKNCAIEKATVPAFAIPYVKNDALKEVTITSGIIPDEALKDVSSLKTVTISGAVTAIGENAFKNCAIEKATVHAFAIPYVNNDALKEVTITAGSIASEAFKELPNLKSVTIKSSGLINIGEEAFKNCENLSTITISETVVSIGENAFAGCAALKAVIYEGDIAKWLAIEFENEYSNPIVCAKYLSLLQDDENGDPEVVIITELIIPNEATTVNEFAFAGLIVEEIKIHDAVTAIGENAFKNCAIEKATVPAFAIPYVKNDALKEVTITSGIIPDEALKDVSSLKTVTISGAVTAIGEDAFKNCAIEKATLPAFAIPYVKNDAVKEVIVTSGMAIDNKAFSGCSRLEKVILPETVTTIGDQAFTGCSRLSIIELSDAVTAIGSQAFTGCDLLQFNYYKGCKYLGNDDNKYAILVKAEANDHYSIHENTAYIYDKAFENCKDFESITVPNGVKKIGEYAFSGCETLTTAIIGSGVTEMGEGVFFRCYGLVSVELNCSLDSIPDKTFYNCSELKRITIPNGVESIGEWAFYYCTSLKQVDFPETITVIGKRAFSQCISLTDVELPDAIEIIEERAFSHCSKLTELVLPERLEEIKSYAFEYCRSITTITLWDSTAVSVLTLWTAPDAVSGEKLFLNCDSLNEIVLKNGSTTSSYYYSEEEPAEPGHYWHFVEGEVVFW